MEESPTSFVKVCGLTVDLPFLDPGAGLHGFLFTRVQISSIHRFLIDVPSRTRYNDTYTYPAGLDAPRPRMFPVQTCQKACSSNTGVPWSDKLGGIHVSNLVRGWRRLGVEPVSLNRSTRRRARTAHVSRMCRDLSPDRV